MRYVNPYKRVCGRCNGTGTQLQVKDGVTYGFPCSHRGRPVGAKDSYKRERKGRGARMRKKL